MQISFGFLVRFSVLVLAQVFRSISQCKRGINE